MRGNNGIVDVYRKCLTTRFGASEAKDVPTSVYWAFRGVTQQEALAMLDKIDRVVKKLPEYDGVVDFGSLDFPSEPLGWVLLKAFYPREYDSWSREFGWFEEFHTVDCMFEDYLRNVSAPFYAKYGYRKP